MARAFRQGLPTNHPARRRLNQPKQSMKTKYRFATMASSLALAFLPPLLAQSTPPPAASDPNEEKAVVLTAYEVTSALDHGYRATNSVTATRTALPIFDIPLSVSVMTEEFVKDIAGDGSLLDATRYIASVVGETRNGNAGRGIFGAGNGTIRSFPVDAILRNGVYRRGGFNLENIDRIEILKGPVSVFFGAAQPGGTINYITKRPQFVRKGEVTASLTEYPSKWATDVSGTAGYRGELSYNDHVGDAVAYSFYASSQDRAGWHDNEYFKSTKFEPKILWRPNDKLSLLLEYEYYDYKSNPTDASLVSNPKYYLDYKNPPAQVLAFHNLTAAQYRARINGSGGQWGLLWLQALGDKGDLYRRYGLHTNIGMGSKAIDAGGQNQPYVRPSFSFQGKNHFQNTLNRVASAELTLTPFSWLTVRTVAAKSLNLFDWVSTFKSQPNADYTVALATSQGAISRNEDLNGQIDALIKFKTGPLSHTIVLGGDHFNTDGENTNRNFNYSTAPAVVTAAGTVLSGLNAVQNWDFLRHGLVVPDSTDYITGFQNKQMTDTRSWGRYATWNGEFKLAGRKVLLTWGERREQYTVHSATGVRSDSKGPASTKGIMVSVTDWMNVYASTSENYRPNAPGFPGGGLSAEGVGVNRDINGNRVPGMAEDKLLPDQTGEGKDIGIKVQTADGKWSATLGWFQVDRANIRFQDSEALLRDPRNAPGSFYPQRYNADGTPDPTSLRVIDSGFQAVRPFTAAGQQRAKGVELEVMWTPMLNYQLMLSFTDTYFSKSMKNPALTGAAQYEMVESGRRLGYSPKYSVGLFNKYTFINGRLKGFSVAAGINGMSTTMPRVENIGDAYDFSPGFVVGDLTLGYRAKFFEREIWYTLNCNNVTDKLYQKGQFAYGEPRKITFRTTFAF